MHKLMKDSNRFVSDMVDGLVLAHPDLYKKVEGVNVVARKVPLDGKVGLVSGGGSGHEPAHAGFVGDG
ncbi:MAG: dihydroxyacetone kinase subunit DhaK, partial [Exiguobacterium acetylicum]